TIVNNTIKSSSQLLGLLDSSDLQDIMILERNDIILSRYSLISPLNQEPGLQVWSAKDNTLSKLCQIYIINDKKHIISINDITALLALSELDHCPVILQFTQIEDVTIVVTPLNEGITLKDYLDFEENSLSYNAIRSIVGETLGALQYFVDKNIYCPIIDTNTIRLTNNKGVEISDLFLAPVFADTITYDKAKGEQLLNYQLAALIYAMVTREPVTSHTKFSLEKLPKDMPYELRVLCERGLRLEKNGKQLVPIITLKEFSVLLDNWQPLANYDSDDINVMTLLQEPSRPSITGIRIKAADAEDIIPYPDNLITDHAHIIPSTSDASVGERIATKLNNAVFFIRFSLGLVGTNTKNAVGTANKNARLWIEKRQQAEEAKRALKYAKADLSDFMLNSSAPVPDITDAIIRRNEEEFEKFDNTFNKFQSKFLQKAPWWNHSIFRRRLIIISIIAVIVLSIFFGAAHTFIHNDFVPDKSNPSGMWPSMTNDKVRFGDRSFTALAEKAIKDDAANKNNNLSESAQSGENTEKSDSAKQKIVRTDKYVNAVPTPAIPENTTAYKITTQKFLSNPNGQSGYGYAMHLDRPQRASKFVITIRSSGGKGYLRVNTTSDPTQGTQVAEFTFDQSKTTTVEFTPTKAQDFLLWVPIDSLPNNQLYIDSVKIY
ncbi:MAG: hypothetical protein Q3961_02100, partial [Bifidobacteriaceae bacterium]|nr:hypothetical protein [Bifidobacteriaceae bacterium]